VPIVHAVSQCAVVPSFRVRQVRGMFDLPGDAGERTEFTVELPSNEEAWSIGLIVGPSGSGKTTAARQAFGEHVAGDWDWPKDRSILDAFPEWMGIAEITGLLSSVGFSSPPAWVRPFAALSNGEQFRVNLARAMAEMPELAVVDEFTSVVDRTVARIGSAALAKAVRRRGAKFVAVTCHYDVIEWLEPDWILDMADGSLARRGLRRPEIRMDMARCQTSAWKFFARHHYLNSELHPSAQCFVGTVEDKPATFVAALPFPHPINPGWREHRCVCFPDFQGLGIGSAASEFVASLFVAGGKPYTSVTSHPAMIRHRARSPLWRMTRAPSHAPPCRKMRSSQSSRRVTASFRYIGPARAELAEGFGLSIRNGRPNQ
jgi:energy-coupling factor transporter ATP-binding protein EcfA2